MKRISRIAMWVSVGYVAVLAAYSIVGAFVGARRAGSFFNSPPLAVYWVLLTLLLISGFVLFRRLRSSFGLFAVHLGLIMVLLGAMYGSKMFYNFATEHLGETRIESGMMQLFQAPPGMTLDQLDTSEILDSRGKEVIGHLPFALALEKFSIEHHRQGRDWLLGIEAPPAGKSHDRRYARVKWRQGEEFTIPLIGGTVKVLQYFDSARAAIPSADECKLEVTDADGKKVAVVAKVGQTVEVANPEGRLQILEVFTHLRLERHQGQPHPVNVPGSYSNPALRLLFTPAEGEASQVWAFKPERNFPDGVAGVKVVYLLPPPRIVKDPGTLLPALEVLITRNGHTVQTWLIAEAGSEATAYTLPDVLAGDLVRQEDKLHGHDTRTYLMMGLPAPPPKQYYASLAILEEGETVGRKTIWVNNPLHYGGYHFYQADYGGGRMPYTVLQVKYDAGLWPVYAGFFLLCAGLFWLFWFKPAWGYLKKRQTHNA